MGQMGLSNVKLGVPGEKCVNNKATHEIEDQSVKHGAQKLTREEETTVGHFCKALLYLTQRCFLQRSKEYLMLTATVLPLESNSSF